MSIGWSSNTPTPAMRVAIERKTRKVTESVDSSLVLFHLLPHDGVDALSGRVDLGLPSGTGQRGVDLLDRDRSVPLDSESGELVDQMVRGLPRDVAQDDVADRLARGAGQDDHVGDADRIGEQRADRIGAVSR